MRSLAGARLVFGGLLAVPPDRGQRWLSLEESGYACLH